MTEEKFVRTICVSLRFLAWALLVFGIFFSIAASAVLAPLLVMSRWSGVVLLFVFILVFLSINLTIKIAEMVLKIKSKVQAG